MMSYPSHISPEVTTNYTSHLSWKKNGSVKKKHAARKQYTWTLNHNRRPHQFKHFLQGLLQRSQSAYHGGSSQRALDQGRHQRNSLNQEQPRTGESGKRQSPQTRRWCRAKKNQTAWRRQATGMSGDRAMTAPPGPTKGVRPGSSSSLTNACHKQHAGRTLTQRDLINTPSRM